MSTVAAISTPNAVGGLAVIRISGENALTVAERIFRPFGNGKKPTEMSGYTCAYGIAHDNGEHIDDCILTVFKSPHSYTGEDTAEISCHGGLFVSRKILRLALQNGAEPAEAGEFTKRAFLNGKLDLTQAESVMDVISAKGELELKMSSSLKEGAVYKKAKRSSERLLALLSGLAAWTDYPDDDIPEVEPEHILAELKGVSSELFSLIESYDDGRIIREGISTAIIGRPNVGKSTLFNCLSGCERSIVTDIAGTTRDIVEETVKLGDIVLRLSDTAGIHETEDVIEGIGVEIAEKTLESAELIIAVFDGSCPPTEDDFDLINKINNKKCVAVINKTDAGTVSEFAEIEDKFIHRVYISARENTGIESLEKAIESLFEISPDSFSSVSVANERQKHCIEQALSSINSAICALESGEMLDAVNVLIDEAEQHILELTGERITEAVVNEVFSRFCVGK
ncbi:MAG: tRNA uridine-5-carboxymethylaminomethyl(34) synthesis GTPase MnmE [Ruminococcus flavefaciens]|nr:tRNA uridine-5-carboxymethylaminomethyl(34) synthesis GTPase MnmE [Ruminococcus flavefaciens]MCM1228638.1 tRNA uridine-5-carboxymethylaminomethyl(34) synthesis GTPase MnmE [Ruminococcus flavefaciens]